MKNYWLLRAAFLLHCLPTLAQTGAQPCFSFSYGMGNIVCTRQTPDGNFSIVLDSAGYLQENLISPEGRWLAVNPISQPETQLFSVQQDSCNVVVSDANGFSLPLQNSGEPIWCRLRFVAAAQATTGDFYALAFTRTPLPIFPGTLDSMYVLQISNTGQLKHYTFLREAVENAPIYPVAVWLAPSNDGGIAAAYATTEYKTSLFVSQIGPDLDSIYTNTVFIAENPHYIGKKSPCDSQHYYLSGEYTLSAPSSFYFNTFYLDYDFSQTLHVLRQSRATMSIFIPQNNGNISGAQKTEPDGATLAVTQMQKPSVQFTPPDDFLISKKDSTGNLQWEKTITLDFIPFVLTELPGNEAVLFGIKNGQLVAVFTYKCTDWSAACPGSLLDNSDFENGIAPWNGDHATWTEGYDVAHSGAACVAIQAPAGNAGLQVETPLTAGPYSLVYWGRESGSGVANSVEISAFSANNNLLGVVAGAPIETNIWTPYTVNFDAPSGTSQVKIRFYLTDTAPESAIWLDDVCLSPNTPLSADSPDAWPPDDWTFTMIPNPATDKISVRMLGTADETFRVSICNQLGINVFEENISDAQLIPTNTLPEGLYFVTVARAEHGLRTQRLVVRRQP